MSGAPGYWLAELDVYALRQREGADWPALQLRTVGGPYDGDVVAAGVARTVRNPALTAFGAGGGYVLDWDAASLAWRWVAPPSEWTL